MKIYLIEIEYRNNFIAEHNIEYATTDYEDAKDTLKEIIEEDWFKNYIVPERYEITDNYVKSDIEYKDNWCDVKILSIDVNTR